MNIFQNNQNYFSHSYFTDEKPKDSMLDLFEPQEAFMLGNLFKNLYMTYQGFSNYCLQPMNQRQQALLNVQIYEFAAHEVNLYLDTHPQDQSMLDLYQTLIQKVAKAKQEFEDQFGPLTVKACQTNDPFKWIQGPWPWEYQ